MPTFDIPAELVETLRAAQRVAVLTGAGISAESGIPTFRDAQTGLWAKYDPHELATAEAFKRNPRLVWDWYQWRRELVAPAQPNAGHIVLAELERRVPQFTLITQNVDSLHQRAGSRNVIELHGNLARTKCFNENIVIDAWQDTGDVPPHCPRCGGLLRPDVVWFGEYLPEDAIATAHVAAANCDVFLSVGTSTLVNPAAMLPYEAVQAGATVIEINPDDTPMTSHVAYALKGPAGAVLPAMLQALSSTNKQAKE